MDVQQFVSTIQEGYKSKGSCITLGAAILNGQCYGDAKITIPLKMMNRHGLIAGATGSGKTKSLQVLAEQLSRNGVPSLLMDIKGDLSGIAAAGATNEKIEERHEKLGVAFEAQGSPVELLSLSDEAGARMRATVTEFGPILFSKILGLNDTQTGIMSIVFQYCDDKKMPLVDLKDVRKVLQYVTEEGKAEIEKDYGKIAATSIGTIMRSLVTLEQQGAERFFGEPSFEVKDLCRKNSEGQGVISVLRLTDIQDKPNLFSTFMLSLLAEIYASFPEAGDLDRPKLVIFIDEAHLVFSEASKALLDQLESIIKLIRSKGVGIYFCTQVPDDVPESILGQLGLKIQHTLRAFTAKDRKGIKLAAQNFPESEYYVVEELLTGLGIGEALVTALSEKGSPTPLAHTLLRAPESRMGVLTEGEIEDLANSSDLVSKYNRDVDSKSAYEILTAKMEAAQAEEEEVSEEKESNTPSKAEKEEPGLIESLTKNTMVRQVGRAVAKEITRGLLGVLGLGGGKKKGGWF
ncbi:MAG: helicase HerA-like domain-containing protein [Bacteroidia bacterium]